MSLKIKSTDKYGRKPLNANNMLPQLIDYGWLLFGRPRQGKTELIKFLIDKYQDDFDYFFIITPAPIDDKLTTIELNKKKNVFGEEKVIQIESNMENIPLLIAKIKHYRTDPEEYQPKKLKKKTNIEDPDEWIIKEKDPKKWLYPKVLIAADDMTGYNSIWSEQSPLAMLYYRRRQFGVAMIAAVHNPYAIKPNIRRTSDIISIFGIVGQDLIRDIVKENSVDNVNDIIELVKTQSQIPHSFVSWYKHNNKVMVGLDKEVKFD